MAKRALVHQILPDAHYNLNIDDEGARKARLCAQKAAQHLAKTHGVIDSTIILGDWLDAAAFSGYDPTTFEEAANRQYKISEVKPCLAAMDVHQAVSKKLVFIEGNHCNRIVRYLLRTIRRGPLQDIWEDLAPQNLLSRHVGGKARKNFTWVPYGRRGAFYRLAPNFVAVHGLSTSKNAAMAHLDIGMGTSIIHGDTHRRQEVTRRHPFEERLVFAMSPGCLAPLDADFHRGKPFGHTHGFAVMFQSTSDPSNWTIYQVPIHDGYCVLPDGKEILVK